MSAYHCKHCGKTVERDSDKQWVKSYCDATGKTVHMQKENTKLTNEELMDQIAEEHKESLMRLAKK